MKVLAYDTETTGLPLWDQPSEHPEQPRVCELAAVLFDDTDGEQLATLHTIIRPDGWTIPAETAAIHGITTEFAESMGTPMRLVLPVFLSLWERSDVRCAHNESFDRRMLRIELFRTPPYTEADADKWMAAPAFCTQAKSTPILKLPPTEKMIAAGRRHSKSANLSEAYEYFTGKKLQNAHSAMADVMACVEVYMALQKSTEAA